MGLLSTLTGRTAAPEEPAFDEAALLGELEKSHLTIGQFSEAIAELELRLLDMDERGWVPLGDAADFDFDRDFLARIIRSSRVHALKNPLVKRIVGVYTVYVWGQGISVTAKGTVNDVVQAFLSDPQNRRAITGHKARTRLNRSLMTDGTVPLRFFATKDTGRVVVRYVPIEQVRGVVKNPDDTDETWFYRREWSTAKGAAQVRLYPDIGYRPSPAKRQQAVDGVEIDWDTPMYLHKVNDLEGMDFGVPEVYAALDWAKASKEYIEDWKKLVRSLTRWAWKMKTKGDQSAVDAATEKINTQFGVAGVDANPAPTTGSAFVGGQDVDLEPIKTGGATIQAEDVRRLVLMVATSVGLPETFFGDASVGSLATAKSLDRPTELLFADYQSGWGETYEDILRFVVDWAARAPQGLLRHLFDHEDTDTGEVVLKETDPESGETVNREIDIDWPPIVHEDAKDAVEAIGIAVKTGAIDDAPLIARLLLTALGEDDIDAAMQRLHPSDGSEPEAVPIVAPVAAPPVDESTATNERLAAAIESLRPLLRG